MGDRLHKSKLKLLFADIISSFSVAYSPEFGKVYIKHLSNLNVADLDIRYEEYLQEAINEGIPTTETQEKYIIAQDLWTKEKDDKIHEKTYFLEGLRQTKAKLFKPKEVAEFERKIKETENEILDLKLEKENLISFTAEKYAAKKINELYIFYSFYKDSALKERFFTDKTFDELSDYDISVLNKIYETSIKNLNSYNLQRISLAPFFSSAFYLCNDDPYIFFGKPIIYLTFYQIELFGYARYFKNILSELKTKPSDDILDDPDKLINQHNVTKNVDNATSNNPDTQNQAIVGMTQKELKEIGIETQGDETFKKMKKEGKKRMTLADMI